MKPPDATSIFDIDSVISLTYGALTQTFESPQGIRENPYTHEEILNCFLILFRETFKMGVNLGFRPPAKRPNK